MFNVQSNRRTSYNTLSSQSFSVTIFMQFIARNVVHLEQWDDLHLSPLLTYRRNSSNSAMMCIFSSTVSLIFSVRR